MSRAKFHKYIPGIMIMMLVLCPAIMAQDQVIENISINTSENYSASSITMGPEVTIESEGNVQVHSNTLAIKGPFIIVSGGQLNVLTGTPPVNIGEEEQNVLPENFIVSQNYPNPFNPLTHINYDLPATMNVEIVIYNTSGQIIKKLATSEQSAGSYTISWDGTDSSGNKVSSGVYYYRVKAGNHVINRKMTLLK